MIDRCLWVRLQDGGSLVIEDRRIVTQPDLSTLSEVTCDAA